MLTYIAQKPKSLQELIQSADIQTIVMKVNQAGNDQKKWFTALLNTQVSIHNFTFVFIT